MRPSSWIALIVAALFLAGGGFLLWRRSEAPPPPEVLIRQSLRDGEEAARARSVGGIMDIVSDDFKGPFANKTQLRLALVRALQGAKGIVYDIRVSAPTITFPPDQPDRAIVMTTITVIDTSGGNALWGGQPVTLVMRKEQERRWLLFSQDRWRVVSALNLPSLDIGGGDTGGLLGL